MDEAHLFGRTGDELARRPPGVMLVDRPKRPGVHRAPLPRRKRRSVGLPSSHPRVYTDAMIGIPSDAPHAGERLASVGGERGDVTALPAGSRIPRSAGIYFDYAATTPVAPEVANAMAGFLTADGIFGNPSSVTHKFGHAASEAVEDSREHVARLLSAKPREIFWTSGATESINLALKGIMRSAGVRGRHLVVSALEHKAVLDTASWLAANGCEVTHLKPGTDGAITPDIVRAAVRPDTALVSVMSVNNELGTVTDISAISSAVHDAGAYLHVDAVQAAARLPLDVRRLNVDLLSISGHKIYGPKGIGALFVRSELRHLIAPQTHGGAQEGGVRPGTLPTHQIAGFGEAARLAKIRLESDSARIRALDARFLQAITSIDSAIVNGDRIARVPGILNVAFPGVAAESLMLGMADVAVSAGSACTSESVEPSHVLLALGVSEAHAYSSIRFSFGRYTTETEIDFVAGRVAAAVPELRSIAA